MWRLADGMWKTCMYAEPFSRHNPAKHWVDDINNHCHDPTRLEEVWKNTWCLNQQFTHLLLVAEAIAVQAWARAKKEMAMPALVFRKKLVMWIMANKLNNNGVAAASPMRFQACISSKHV
jgi:hypothetical protein